MDFQCLLHWVASPAWITWSSPGQLLLLVKSHIGEKAYVCNQYGGGFSKHFSLKQHRAFRLEKNHYESRCGKAFSAYSVLRQPQKPRNGEKPCEWMQMNFIQSVHLHRHQRTHTGGSYINIINVGKMSAGELTFIHFRGPSLTNYWWKAFIDHLTFKKTWADSHWRAAGVCDLCGGASSWAPLLVCTGKLWIGLTREIGRRQERLYQEMDTLRTYADWKKRGGEMYTFKNTGR